MWVELRHHCAIGDGALYIIGVYEPEERVRTRWASEDFETVMTSAGFPSPKTAEITILQLHAIEPPLSSTDAGPLRRVRVRLDRVAFSEWSDIAPGAE